MHVGTNDADREGTTAIVGKFRALVRELKARRVGKIWISGILPVMGEGRGTGTADGCRSTASWTECVDRKR